MEMTVFRTKVQRAVSEALGEEYSVELREVQKNNGVILQGLMIRRAQENMMPTIYLNSFLKAYEEGATFADIIRKIVTVYREDAVGKQIDVSFFTDFEKVKDRICFRLINRDKNRSFLEKVPYIPVLLCIRWQWSAERNDPYLQQPYVRMECDGQRIVCLCCEKYSQTFSLRHYADGKCIGGTAGGASGRCKTTSGTGDSHADPDKCRENIRCLLHFIPESAGAAGGTGGWGLLSDSQFGS